MMMEPKTRFAATGMPDRDWWRALWPDPKGVLEALGVAPAMTVIDLCCGDGTFTAPLAKLVGATVYALDLDREMLARAAAEATAEGAPACIWVEGDALNVAELVGEKVDLVFHANTFHGAPDKTALARAVAAVLKPGGRFVVVNWHRRPREETPVLGRPRGPKTEMRLTPADVRAAVEPAGFELDAVVELPPYHYGAVFRKLGASERGEERPGRA